LLVLLGLDRTIAAGDGPLQFEGSLTGVWGSPLRLKANLSGADWTRKCRARGAVVPAPKASVNLKVRSVNLAPLFGSSRPMRWRKISAVFACVAGGDKLTFDDLDSAIAGSRLRGRVALTLDDARTVEGELGLDALDLAPVFALAIGSGGTMQPSHSGRIVERLRGVAFQALRGALPGGAELRPLSGAIKSDGQSLTFDTLKGGIGGGEANANIDVKQGANGIALNARVQFAGVDGAPCIIAGWRCRPAARRCK